MKNITTEELYQKVIANIPNIELPPLYKAIMEECCENAIDAPDIMNEEILLHAARTAFVVAVKSLKGVLSASVKATNADQVTLNYRGQKFIIHKDSKLIAD